MAGKGSQFERDMCRLFSRWVSGGDRDDLFWRTSQSGGRATACSRRGTALKTKGFYGDMALVGGAEHEAAKLFADSVSVEFKRGYNRVSVQDYIDLPKRAATRTFEQFVSQATQDAVASGRLWLLVWKRDNRDPIVVMPGSFRLAISERTRNVFSPVLRDAAGEVCAYWWADGTRRFAALPLESLFKSVLVKGVPYDTWRNKERPGPASDDRS